MGTFHLELFPFFIQLKLVVSFGIVRNSHNMNHYLLMNYKLILIP